MVTQKRDPFPQGSLSKKTFELLQEQRKTMSLPLIAERAGVQYFWLRQYADGTFTSPSVDRVQALYEALTGTKLISD